MKILRKGRKPHKLYRGKCRECGCEIECEEHEAKWNAGYIAPREPAPGYYSHPCPTCTVEIFLEEK